jgi:Domain of unknown function (DUF4157)
MLHPIVQAKLRLGAPNDNYEREADRAADQVMREQGPAPESTLGSLDSPETLQRKCAACSSGGSGLCPECEQELQWHALPVTPLVQRTVESGSGMNVPPIVNDVLSSNGHPLDRTTRAFFEPRFGHDFSPMRIHADARAAESARAVEARAYTVGRHVVFGAGQYALATPAGRRLMAHELAHVVQQDRGQVGYSGVMQRSPLVCSEKFPQEDKIYGGEATKETVGKRRLFMDPKDPKTVDLTTMNNFHSPMPGKGLRDYQELQGILNEHNVNFDITKPSEARDCSPGEGLRYAYYPIGNALGLEAVEFCQKGEYLYFKFVCVARSAGGEAGQQPVIKESGTGVEAFDPTGKSVGSGYINDEGYITMTIRTEDTSLRGGDVFNAIYDALHAKGVSIKGVVGVWTNDPKLKSNLDAFNKAIKDSESPKDAALRRTFTGVMCERRGLIPKEIYVEPWDPPHTPIDNIEGAIQGGPFESVIVYFRSE